MGIICFSLWVKLEPCHSLGGCFSLYRKKCIKILGTQMQLSGRKKRKTEKWVQPCNCCNILLEGKFGSYQWWWIHVVFLGTGLANRLIPTVKLLKPTGSGTSTCFCTRHILFHRSHQERINYLKGPLPRHSWIVSLLAAIDDWLTFSCSFARGKYTEPYQPIYTLFTRGCDISFFFIAAKKSIYYLDMNPVTEIFHLFV